MCGRKTILRLWLKMAYSGAELKTVKTIAKRLKENWKCSIKNNDNNKKNKHLILEK